MTTTFGRVAPTFFVTDLDRGVKFWTQALGFELAFTNGAPVSFAIVRRDAAEIHLGIRPDQAGRCHCHIMVEGIDELAEQLDARGVTVRQAPRDQPWGLRDMVIADPDGNTIEIAQPLKPASQGSGGSA